MSVNHGPDAAVLWGRLSWGAAFWVMVAPALGEWRFRRKLLPKRYTYSHTRTV